MKFKRLSLKTQMVLPYLKNRSNNDYKMNIITYASKLNFTESIRYH